MGDCRCTCHTGPYAPCSVPAGCGHLHSSRDALSYSEALSALGDTSRTQNPAKPPDRPTEPAGALHVAVRPAGACLTHRPPSEGKPWQRADAGYRTCGDCADRLHRWLSLSAVDADGRPDSIPALYALLNPRPGNTANLNDVRPPGFASRSPANDHIVAMRDARTSVAMRPGDPRSAPAILRSWVLNVWDERYDDDALDAPDYRRRRATLPIAVVDCARWLDKEIDWISRQEMVSEFYTELASLRSALRSIGSRRYKIGECPNTIDLGDTTRQCGVLLFAPLDGDTISCWACGRRWPRPEWEKLLAMLSPDQTPAS